MSNSIGIIAGRGQFPVLVAREARTAGKRVVMCGFHGHTDPNIEREADVFLMLHLGQFGRVVAFFEEHDSTDVCFAGGINKPRALDLRPDWRAARVLFRLRGKGDNAILHAVIEELEHDGLHVVQAAELVPNLRAPEGVLSKRQPTEEEWDDIKQGWPIARIMGKLDIGQCIAMKRGIVLAVEGPEGTDAALKRGGEIGKSECVAIKLVKPGQDERIDLPALGTTTIDILIKYGYSCLAFESGKTLFFDRAESLERANKYGLALVALDSDFEGDSIDIGGKPPINGI